MAFAALLRTRDWERAREQLEGVRPWLSNAELAKALQELVDSEGQRVPAAETERLGYDSATPHASYPVPSSEDAAARECLSCFAREPWARFADVVREWLGRVPPPVADAVRHEACLLSYRELWTQASRGGPRALEVARFCAELIREGRAEADLEPLSSLCLRVVARTTESPLEERATARRCVTVLEAALRYPALVPLVEQVWLEAGFRASTHDVALQGLKSLLATRLSAAAMLKAALLWEAQQDERDPSRPPDIAPDWLVEVATAMGRDPREYAQHLDRGRGTLELLERVTVVWPSDLAFRHVEQLWPYASEELREALALSCVRVGDAAKFRAGRGRTLTLDRMRDLLAMADPMMASAPDDALRAFLRSPEGKEMARELQDLDAFDGPLPPHLYDSWKRVAERIVPYSLELLETALDIETSSRRRAKLGRAFFAQRPTLVARVAALEACEQDPLPESRRVLEARLLDGYEPELLDACRALQRAVDRFTTPLRTLRKLAKVVLEAAEAPGYGLDDTEVIVALDTARRLVPHPRPRRKQTGPKKTRTRRSQAAPSKGASGPKARSGTKPAQRPVVQQELFSLPEDRP